MIVNQMRESLAQSLRDVGMEFANERQLLIFINDAARDAISAGVYLPLKEDTSIQLNDETDYLVPAGFCTLHAIRIGFRRLPYYWWRLLEDEDYGDPIIRFDARFFDTETETITLEGQRRPHTYATKDDVLDFGLESFLHERATVYGARFMARMSEDTQQYIELEQKTFVTSTEQLARVMAQPRFQRHLYARDVPER